MTHPSCAPTVLAFLNAAQDLGVVGSGIAQGPVLVSIDLPCNTAHAPLVSCEQDMVLSAHSTIALAQATDAAQEAANALQAWIGAHAAILVDNAPLLRFTAGVFHNDGLTTQILQLTSTMGRMSVRGKRAEFEGPLTALLDTFARMEGGTRTFLARMESSRRTFQNHDLIETSHTVRAGNAASAIAYHALIFDSQQRPGTEKWCEVVDAGLYAHDVARLLEGYHG